VSNITLKCPRSIEVSTNRRLGTGWPARRSRKGSWLAAVIAAAILLGAGLAVAQTREANLLAMDNPVRVAPVTIDGRILFQVRGVSAFPAVERAEGIAGRIRAVAADPSIPSSSLRLAETEHSTDILAGDNLLVSIVNGDVQAEGDVVGRPLLAQLYLKRIKTTIDRFRAEREPEGLLRQTTIALIATLVLALALVTLTLAVRSLKRRIDLRYKSAIENIESRAHRLVSAHSIWRAVHAAFRMLSVLAAVVLTFVYIHFVLGLFPWTRVYAVNFRHLAFAPLNLLVSRAIASVPNLLLIAVIVVCARYLLKLAHLAFDSIKHGHIKISGFDPDWSDSTYNIIRVLIILFVAIVCYPFIPGSESSAFKGVTIFIGVLFSLGSSAFLANLIAGYTMTYRRAFHVGDRIQVGDLMGDVAQVGLMVTHLRSVKNEEFVIPNSLILNSNVINYSSLTRQRGLILHTTVGIGYETPWRQVEAMLLLAAERTPSLLREPPPFILQKSLGDFAVNYELNVYCDNPSAMYQLYTELHRNILDVFNEYKVQIMTPAYVADPSAPKVVRSEEWFAQPAQAPPLRKTGTD
jgi:small-conductance mechanosensitive channel